MGQGHPHRQKGRGKGTPDAWRNVGLEGEPILQDAFTAPDKKKSEARVIDLKARKPVRADSMHTSPSIPKNNSKNWNSSVEQEDQYATVKPEKEKTPMFRSGPTPETAIRKPSHEISTEERITAFEDKIATDFGEGERRYVRQWVDIYPTELHKAIDKREKNGKKVTEKEIPAIRLSFINNIARWGMGRGMAPEKAELLEKYLELKLPLGISALPFKETKKPLKEEIFQEDKKRIEQTDQVLLDLYRTIPEKMWIVKEIRSAAENAIEKMKIDGKWENLERGKKRQLVSGFAIREFRKRSQMIDLLVEEKIYNYMIISLNI